MNIRVFMLYTKEFDGVAAVTVPSWQRYCARHGYDLTIHRGGYGERERNIGFQKTELALNLLHGMDALMVVDCDVLVTNHTVKLESLLDNEHSMFATHDVNGFNAGVYLIRNTGQSLAFLYTVGCVADRKGVLGEQDAMRYLFDPGRYDDLVKILPQNSMNSYLYQEYGESRSHAEGQWLAGDFLLHLPGITNERRIEIFNSTLPEVVE